MKNGFVRAITNGVSLEEVTKWKNAYDTLSREFQKRIDDTRQSISQEFLTKINTLNDQLSGQKQLINQLQEELQGKKQVLCISEISSGKIESAVKYFQALEDDSKLPEIIRSVYTKYGELDTVNNIINFVKKTS